MRGGHIRELCLAAWSATWIATCVALTSTVVARAAEVWPSRVVSLVVPFGPGSGSDIVARVLTAQMSDVLGRQVIVENVGGAGGVIGVKRAAKAVPDGYQVVLGAVDTFAQSQYLFTVPPFNSVAEFEPVGLAVEQPLVLVVRKDLPVTNLQEFAAYLRSHHLRFGSAGVGAAPYLACSMLTTAIGGDATHVPYRSAAPALTDMMAGQIDYYCPLANAAVGLIESKSIKVLAVLTKERSPLFPELPTAREQGLDVVDGYYWMGMFVPKGTPAPIIATLNAAIGRTLDNRATQDHLRDVAATVVPPERRSSGYLRDFLGSEITKWSAIMKASNVPQQ
jgi:tripartite-type tricarboxylate transporter receptor subunit TctC